MWILSRVNNEDKVYLLCDKPKYTVGRQKICDIIGEATQLSLGRFHATLHPYEDRVEIIDTESKYGTYINEKINSNEKINPNEPVPLKDGDTIRFGFNDFTWKLEKVDIVVLTSTLTDPEKINLKRDVCTLGGQFIDQWSDTCTHLVVKDLTLTVKVLQALCHAIPIVKPDYFKAMVSSIRSKSTMPEEEKYQPTIVERIVGSNVSLQVNIDRKRLFVGKTFIFMTSKHMETFKGIIKCGMGECSSIDTKKWQRRSLVKPGVIVINNSASSTQSQVATEMANDLNDFLRSKGSRMVPDSEISLAILHCSLDKFCNPNYTLKDNFESKPRAVPSTLLADNTPVNQNGLSAALLTDSINVPETIDQPNTLASTVPNNSQIIDLMDDDDDVLLVQSADLAVSMEGMNKGKRKNSTDIEEPSTKKPNLEKNTASAMKTTPSFVFDTPQRSTRSASKIKNSSAIKHPTESGNESVVQEDKNPSAKPNTEPGHQAKRNLRLSNRQEETEKSSEKFSMEISIIEGSQKQQRAASSTQSNFFTSTQVETPSKRKRIAHRPKSSTFGGNDSDSDDELFKFSNEPSVKKSRPTKDSDSDSDDNRNYPQSSGPVAPVSIPPLSMTQPSQIGPDCWLSRPTPSQTFTDQTTKRSKPKKRNDRVDKSKSANVSAGWQIGQWRISTPPVQIPTQGWCSKDTIKCANFENEIKRENSNGKTEGEESKWIDSIKCGIQVITKSMNLMSTSGKVFKKQRFIVPTEIIKTSKVYEF